MAAAALAATACAEHFLGGRHAALLEGLGDEAVDVIGDLLEHVLGGDKGLNALMGVGLVLQVLKAVHLIRVELLTTAMALFEGAAQGHHLTVQTHCRLVGQEGLGLLARLLHVRVGHDGGTEGVDLGNKGGGKQLGHGR